MIGEVAIRGPVPGGHASNPADVAVAGAPRWVLGEGGYDMKTLDAPAYKHTNTRCQLLISNAESTLTCMTHMYHSHVSLTRATSTLLRAFSWILTKSPFGLPLRRALMK